MASVCSRCALRLQRAAQADARHALSRSFSSTANTQRQLPTFTESSNPELDNVLSTLREKHFIPAYLHKQERKLIFKQKFRQQLEDNPTTALAGGEEVPLQWIDRRREIPNRLDLVRKALDIIIKEGNAKDWPNLIPLLRGLKEGVKKPLDDKLAEKLIRKATSSRNFGYIIQCLQQADRTGMTLKREVILKNVICALHQIAQSANWGKSATEKALRDANVVAAQLETQEHGTGRELAENDPRTRPEVVAVFLELAAVYAYKYTNAKDETGLVRAYAERLTRCLEKSGTEPKDLALQVWGPHWPMLIAIPIWHGLEVAKAILGKDMPNSRLVSRTLANYEVGLSPLVKELESRSPQAGSYDEQALSSWKACIRP